MKSLNKLFLALILMLIFFVFNNAKAQCPSGYTLSSADFSYTNGGTTCVGKVEFCYKCTPTGPTPASVIVNSIQMVTPSNSCSLWGSNGSAIYEAALSAVRQKWFALCTVPPCSTGTTQTMEIHVNRCAKAKNVYQTTIVGGVSYTGFVTYMEFCQDAAYCVRQYTLCMDYTTTPPTRVETLVSTTSVGTPSCSSTTPSIPPIGKTWEEEWETECYDVICR